MARKTTRLYYGLHPETGKPLYWTLKVKNATRRIDLNGSVEDAMNGKGGVSIGCHLSNVAMKGKTAFPHPALYVSFTKSVALVLTKIVKGQPTSCVRYRHGYSKYVDLNDSDLAKTAVQEHPELFKRRFSLLPYKASEPHFKDEHGRRETGRKQKMQMARGELARLKRAGLIHAAL